MSERIAVGVDAGGTATVAAASRAGSIERTAVVGPANPTSSGVAAAAATIAAAAHSAADGAEPDALYVGAAGAARADVAVALEQLLRVSFPATRNLVVAGDAETALRAAIPAGPGIVVIAGTGSVAYAENGERRACIGGYGYLLGDEGSAFAIGLVAARLLARVYDGRSAADALTDRVERALGCHDREGLLAATYGTPVDVAKLAGLAPSVLALADGGNVAATKIVTDAARDLGDLVCVAAARTGLAETLVAVALAGGLLREDGLLSDLLQSRIAGDLPGASIVRMRDEPVRAALRFAEAMLGA